MTKRAHKKWKRSRRDFYVTPYEVIPPLLRWLPPKTRFHEPCAGDGALINHLENAGHICTAAGDIVSNANDNPFSDQGIQLQDALDLKTCGGDMFITNPPWTRDILHPLIEKLTSLTPVTWLLFDADWAHTVQASRYFTDHRVRKIVSVGRVKWFGNVSGFDNCAWYQFANRNDQPTEFYGKAA